MKENIPNPFDAQKNIREIIKKEKNWDDRQFNEHICSFSVDQAKKSMKGIIGDDKKIIQSYNALEDMNKTLAVMFERLEEWYSLYNPQNKENGERLAKTLSDFEDEALRNYAEMIINFAGQKESLEKHVRSEIKRILPNTSSILEPLLTARMLSMATSIEKLARMTSSNIQLLGAEKALFRHLKSKKKDRSPKFGLIYMSSYIQNAKKDKQGKVARILSSHIMKTVRIDYYSGRREDIKKELNEALKKV